MLKRKMKPSHPGEVLKTIYLDGLRITLGEVAANLGITRKTLSMLINGHQGLSAEMALRLAKAFDTTPELWLNLQNSYDLWIAESSVKTTRIKVFSRPTLISIDKPLLNPKKNKENAASTR